MRKTLTALALLLLLVACTPEELTIYRGGPPRRHWESWEEMKEVLGDHYLYPTYLPEFTARSEHAFKHSDFNNVPRDSKSDELFFGYFVRFSGDWQNDSMFISVADSERNNSVFDALERDEIIRRYGDLPEEELLRKLELRRLEQRTQRDNLLHERERFNEHVVAAGGIDILFFSVYGLLRPYPLPPPPREQDFLDEWYRYHPRNVRIVHGTFTIDTITYEIEWSQYNVDDKYADDEQREGMLRVAKSIIEQVAEVE